MDAVMDPSQQLQQQQTYYSWIRDHFKLDATELEDISSCIALPDMDMPDVLSLLADDDNADGDLLQELEQQQQQHVPQQQSCGDASDGVIWPEVACRNIGSSHEAAATAGGAQLVHEQAAAACDANAHAAGAADIMALSAAAAAAAAGAGATSQLGYQLPASTLEYDAAEAANAGAWCDSSMYPIAASQPAAAPAGAGSRAEEWAPRAVDSAAMHTNTPSSRKGAVAAAVAPGRSSKAVKPKRKPSEAQRQAHKRFRERRKEQMVQLEAEVAAKQQLLQELSAENVSLTAKARVLDQLVASAGEDYALLLDMQNMNLNNSQAQHASTHVQVEEEPTCSEVPPELAVLRLHGSSSNHSKQQLQDAAAAVAAAGGGLVLPSTQQQPQLLAAADEPCQSTIPADIQWQQLLQAEVPALQQQQQGLEQQLSICTGAAGQRRSSSMRSSGSCSGSEAGNNGSLEQLEVAIKQALSPSSGAANFMPAHGSLHSQAELVTLQSLLKGFSAEVMQLVLQVRTEQCSSNSSGIAAAWQSCPANLLLQQQQQQQQLDGLSQGQAWGPPPQQQDMQQQARAAPAAARLQRLLVQTQLAFRRFMVINRLSHYQLNNCNIETGEIEAAAPPGHWAKVARVLRDGVAPQVLSEMMLASQLYQEDVARVVQQRQALVMELQAVLQRESQPSRHKLCCNPNGMQWRGHQLLDAIDSSLRRQYTLEGVYHWAFYRMVPPLLGAEVLVHSYPYLPDTHAILGELQQGAGLQLTSSQQQHQQQLTV